MRTSHVIEAELRTLIERAMPERRHRALALALVTDLCEAIDDAWGLANLEMGEKYDDTAG